MRQLCGILSERLRRGERAVLATVLKTAGSVPRTTGAAMAVFSDGFSGTVGGGAVEFGALAVARLLLQGGESLVKTFSNMPDEADDGCCCGGRVTVLFQPLGPDDAAFFARAAALAGGSEPAFLVRRIADGRVTGLALHTASSPCAWCAPHGRAASCVEQPDGTVLLTEPIAGAVRVYLFGAGHVARCLAPELVRVGFDLTVIDAREALLMGEGFSCARERLLEDPVAAAGRLAFGSNDYAVVMASNHETDFAILGQLLQKRPGYIGCIGSRRKLAMARERLAAAGVDGDEFAARVHAPIGLPIKAETPEEIAVSIAAEMSLFRAEH